MELFLMSSLTVFMQINVDKFFLIKYEKKITHKKLLLKVLSSLPDSTRLYDKMKIHSNIIFSDFFIYS